MKRNLLKSKLHRVTVTHSELEYEGSVAIDSRLLDAADILEYEKLEVYNITNGERFSTYAIRAEKASGIISVNGAAAHRANPGDVVIICTYAELDEKELTNFKPRLVYVDSDNRITHTRNAIPVQVA
ncbi:MAG: aspartate 1-decarboxylase [Acidiferrobacterales bacterium]